MGRQHSLYRNAFLASAPLIAGDGILDKDGVSLSQMLRPRLTTLRQDSAALGSAWQALVLGAAGLREEGEGIALSPHLPDGITRLRFHVYRLGVRYAIEVTPDGHTIREEA